MMAIDRIALEAAVAQCLAEGGDAAERVKLQLAGESWINAAQFAAAICQTKALNLACYETEPCFVDDDDVNNPEALKLLQQMLSLGISRWDPDPMAAIAAKTKGGSNGSKTR